MIVQSSLRRLSVASTTTLALAAAPAAAEIGPANAPVAISASQLQTINDRNTSLAAFDMSATQLSAALANTRSPPPAFLRPKASSTLSVDNAGLTTAGIGISDQGLANILCTQPGSPTTCGGSNETSPFAYFKHALGVRYARIFIPYDTVSTYDQQTRSCVLASTFRGPTSYWTELYNFLLAAQADGLDPLVSLYAGAGGYTDNGHYYADAGVPDLTTNAGASAYLCGIEGLMTATSANNVPVNEWEPWNEPECCMSASNAATMYAYTRYASVPVLARADTIVGGAFATATAHDVDPSGFAYAYVYDLLNAGIQPPVFSLHPYHDVQNSWGCVQIGAGGCSTTETSNLVNMLDAAYGSSGHGATVPQIWLTEAGVWLNGMLHAQLDNNPIAQANAAEGFLNLPRASLQITRAYYYEFQTFPGDGFDSALIASGGSKPSDGDRSGLAPVRPSYCVLALGFTPAQAVSSTYYSICNDSSHSPTDSDWQHDTNAP
jgi:hypothetical protein